MGSWAPRIAREPAVGRLQADDVLEVAEQPLPRVRVGQGPLSGFGDVVEMRLEHRLDQGVLRREAPVERADADAGPGRDLLDAHVDAVARRTPRAPRAGSGRGSPARPAATAASRRPSKRRSRSAYDTVREVEAQVGSRTASRPGVVLAILALAGSGYAMLQSLVVPALPTLQKELDTTPDRRRVDLHDVPPRRLGGDADRRPRGRHVRQEADAPRRAHGACRGNAARGPRDDAAGPDRSPARSRASEGPIFPLAFGIIRDEFPRERVPSGIGARLGAARDRRRARDRAGRPDPRAPRLPLAVLDPVRGYRRDGRGDAVPRPGVADSRSGRVDWLGAVLLSAWLVCLLLSISEAPHWGWTSARTIGLFSVAVVLAVAVDLRGGCARRRHSST